MHKCDVSSYILYLLFVAFIENKLYWCDSKLETIEQRDLSSNIRTVVIDLAPFNGTFFPFDLFLFNDNLYWTDWGTYTILRVSKRGTGEQHYGPAIFEKAGGIHIYEGSYYAVTCFTEKANKHKLPVTNSKTVSKIVETNFFFLIKIIIVYINLMILCRSRVVTNQAMNMS